jgi:uncharacterized membrane protein YagU involved in acid resistance
MTRVDWAGWAFFGFMATVVLTVIMVGSQLVGLSRLDFTLVLGTVFVQDPDRARLAGFFLHLASGQVFAFLYTAAFALLGTSSLLLGALFGLVHGIATVVLIVPLLPTIHPRMASERTGPDFEVGLEPPGPLALNYGRLTPVVAIVGHLVYGAVLGTFLQPG